MSDYRASYRKTVFAAAFTAAAGLGVLAALIRAVVVAPTPWSPTLWLGWSAATVLVGTILLAALLVFTGGLVCLHRDALEQRGVSYAPREPREATPGFLTRGLGALARGLRAIFGRSTRRLGLRPGELVRVRSLDEIRATLDDKGMCDGLPFMPEMVAFCNSQVRVFRRVQKIYDWVQHKGLRRTRDTVSLEGLRCDGAAHGGCQAGCLVLWKEAWLERAAGQPQPALPTSSDGGLADLRRWSERRDAASGEPRHVCQMTELHKSTTPLAWHDPRHYVRDLLGGNVRLRPFLEGVAIVAFNLAQGWRGGVAFPVREGRQAGKTPHLMLDLQPGELVRIKRKHDIEETLNRHMRNRGLWFDAEMIRFCGGIYRVAARVDRLIEEKSGRMTHIGNPCIVLDGVYATGEYQAFAPLAERIFWREIWLERTTPEPAPAPGVTLPAKETHESIAR